jgi:DNA-binding Lrp family transcriptional regulator
VNVIHHDPALALADRWQRDFPLCRRPFASIGTSEGLSEADVIERFRQLTDRRVLGRIGAAVRPNTVGASTLAAMAVPPRRLADVAQTVSAEPGVNHNYEREHEINLWFVVTEADRAAVTRTLDRISGRTGIAVFDLPLERAYHIDLGFRLAGSRRKPDRRPEMPSDYSADPIDRALLGAIEDGLALTPEPFAPLARELDLDEADVLARLGRLVGARVISRFGCILRHRPLGYRANAMAVWDVPDEVVDRVAAQLAERDAVTLCYRRTRRLPAWPYNLFAMVHGRERDDVGAEIADAERAVGLSDCGSAILFSRRCFKQRGAIFSQAARGAA